MMRRIVVICAAVILIIASCMKVSGRCARQEEIEPDAKKIELYARCQRSGWDCWGNETDKFEKEDA